MSIGLDIHALGKQAGTMANGILAGAPLTQYPPAESGTAVVTINRTVAQKLGISLTAPGLETFNFMD